MPEPLSVLPSPKPINTMVFGSPNTCEEGADWIDSLGRSTDQASTDVSDGESKLNNNWFGPAFDAYHNNSTDQVGGFNDVTDDCSDCSKALRDFGSGLRGLQNKAKDLLRRAQAGGLEVQGPIILPPKLDITPPKKPDVEKPNFLDDSASDKVKLSWIKYQHEANGYNIEVEAVNEKRELFNELSREAVDLRADEKNLHEDLRLAFTIPDVDGVAFALTGASYGQSAIANVDGVYTEETKKLDDFKERQKAMTDFTTGKTMSESRMAVVDEVMAKQGKQEARVKAAGQWHKFIRWIPESVRTGMRVGPSDHIPAAAAKQLKGFSYAGTLITAGSEVNGVMRGEKTWSKALADGGGDMVKAAAISRAAAGAARAMEFGPGGVIASGILGGLGVNPVDKMIDETNSRAEIEKHFPTAMPYRKVDDGYGD